MERSSPAQVDVSFDDRAGTYSISAGWTTIVGKMEGTSCIRDDCKPQQLPFPVGLPRQLGMSDKVVDRNHIQGSKTETKTGLGRARNGVSILTVNWDLSRSGGSN